ncbi:DUF1569 domain-containing protein [Glaciecola petra]|uniref:DUF1569 domain-containing protein n=1 Tax=Glaciecola petra TaxID=3075602 RepID=A0ABU2ZVE9_9ALTE|nr:DUF1569 domain-containing protein [Aestuariibacter sp. P117]MDT0596626.1 DUF1569 domain-containing protein [Aestuariibacter sp. P117]
MNRRGFLKSSIVGTAVIGGAGIIAWHTVDPFTGDLSLTSSIHKLVTLDLGQTKSSGLWNVAQILNHCAQSVEYSMLGYPEHKSAFFKSTAGKLAFNAFKAKGRMRHNLSEEIPGADPLIASANVEQAKRRFQTAMLVFADFKGELAPHFAYGSLSKSEYELAHVLHFNNHLQELT